MKIKIDGNKKHYLILGLIWLGWLTLAFTYQSFDAILGLIACIIIVGSELSYQEEYCKDKELKRYYQIKDAISEHYNFEYNGIPKLKK